jgi:DNA-binding transcriptional ArsR family regulator
VEAPPGFRPLTREVELKALAHPLRETLFARLRGREASATQLARELGESVARVHHHLQPLVRAGLVRQAGTLAAGRARHKLYVAVGGEPWPARALFPPGGGGAGWRRLDRHLAAIVAEMAAASLDAHERGPDAGDAELSLTLWLTADAARRLPALLAALGRTLEATADPPQTVGTAPYRVALLSWRRRA